MATIFHVHFSKQTQHSRHNLLAREIYRGRPSWILGMQICHPTVMSLYTTPQQATLWNVSISSWKCLTFGGFPGWETKLTPGLNGTLTRRHKQLHTPCWENIFFDDTDALKVNYRIFTYIVKNLQKSANIYKRIQIKFFILLDTPGPGTQRIQC